MQVILPEMRTKDYKFTTELIKKSRYSRFQDFHNLMRFRIRDILLVSSLYDSFIFEEDGRLYELIRKEYHGLNLSHSPELIQCSSGVEAIELAKAENRFNLIIITLHIDDMQATTFAKKVKEAGLNIPIVLLAYDNREMVEIMRHPDISVFDEVFFWQGDYKIILGIVKSIEDKMNVEHDTNSVGVQSIILIEDNIRFYSSYLPMIYTEILKQSQMLISEGINLSHKFLRMRARPKILLCSTYDEAWNYYKKYEEYILGIISDVDFLRNGKQDSKAGLLFAKKVKEEHPDIPILLQSNVAENEETAFSLGASFLLKDSPTLLQDLKKFMNEHFSFGDFVFKNESGGIVGRAQNLTELEDLLRTVPEESIVFHASRNHFSNWLKARTEFWLAHRLRPKRVSDFNSFEELRQNLIESVFEFRTSRQRSVVSDFNRQTFDSSISTFTRIGEGSLGGKARGLGFVNAFLSNFEIRKKFKGVEIFVPRSVVLGTDIFDLFLEENNLRDFALRCSDDEELFSRFIKADQFPHWLIEDLTVFLQVTNVPLAVRSSSLLEDSQGQPFAGVYDTYMLPNSHPSLRVRLIQLLNMVKRVYASTFRQRAKDYLKVTTYRLEEEKMAVIIQEMVGAEHNGKFYPEFSGVARSYNFYPVNPLKSNDGIVSCALGLGKTIVEGGRTVRFCPKYPHHLLQFATVEDTLNFSQQDFFALELNDWDDTTELTDEMLVTNYDIDVAEEDGTLSHIGSSYSPDNHAIYDGTSRIGAKLFTLAPILKYRVFPLPEILELLLEMGSWGMGSPVEIEFAVNLSVPSGTPRQFGLLQMRPLVIHDELEELDLTEHSKEEVLCESDQVLGNGVEKDIHHIIYVDKDKFDRSKSRDVAREISVLNQRLIKQDQRYLLVGVGRWGTLDPWLGIPVTWDQISGAKAIIESNFKDFNVTPSQGTHFFQNLTSFKVGYFTVNDFLEQGFIDWGWLKKQPQENSMQYTNLIKLKNPLTIKINGHQNKGVVLKPEK